VGSCRAFGNHVKWSPEDVVSLTKIYATATHGELLAAFPGRKLRTIQCKASALDLVRDKPPKRTLEQKREASRLRMAKKWKEDPEGMRAYNRARHHANGDENRAKMAAYQTRRFFWRKAYKFDGVSAADLSRMWKRQRGQCALTGERLDRTAQLDHVIPKARGGSDELSNLRFTTRAVNIAKRDMLDDEFLALCRAVIGINELGRGFL